MSAVSNVAKGTSSESYVQKFPLQSCRLFSKDEGFQRHIAKLLTQYVADELTDGKDVASPPTYKWESGGFLGTNALCWAAYLRKEVLAEYILEKAPENIHEYGNIYGWTPLFFAAMTDSIPIADLLLKKGANPNIQAVERGNLDPHIVAEMALYLEGEDVEPKATQIKVQPFYPAGSTPLYVAAKKGHLEMCRLLIDAGAEVDPKLEPEVKSVLRRACHPVTVKIAKVTRLPMDVAEIAALYAGAPAEENHCAIQ